MSSKHHHNCFYHPYADTQMTNSQKFKPKRLSSGYWFNARSTMPTNSGSIKKDNGWSKSGYLRLCCEFITSYSKYGSSLQAITLILKHESKSQNKYCLSTGCKYFYSNTAFCQWDILKTATNRTLLLQILILIHCTNSYSLQGIQASAILVSQHY